MKKQVLRLSPIFVVAFAFNSPSFGQSHQILIEVTPILGGKYFYWGEYGDASVQLLEEEGFLYGGGVSSKFKFSSSIELYTKFDVYLHHGLVDYNGFLQNADESSEPYKSKTGYLWTEILLNFGYDFLIANHFILAPEIGVQYDYWNRDIDNGGKYGYDEVYNMLSLESGCDVIFPLSYTSKIFFNILGEYPVVVDESINLASRGQGGPEDINLEPVSNIGINCKLGTNVYGWFLSFYFDYMLFSKSDLDNGYFQPRSDRSIWGMKLGYTFLFN